MIRVASGRRRAAVIAALTVLLLPTFAAVAASPPGAALIAPVAPGGTEPPSVHLPPPPGTTSRVSVSSAEAQAAGISGQGRISADGRYVAFTSAAPNLVSGDTNEAAEVFVRDLQAGTTVRLPMLNGAVLPRGAQADQPAISANGEFVAFRYRAPGTSDGEPNTRIYLWQRGKGTVEVAAGGNLPSNVRRDPSVSPDGAWVAFSGSPPSGTVAFPRQVYAWNRQTGQTVLVSGVTGTGAGNAQSGFPSVSSGGAFIAFESLATNLAATDNNPQGMDIFVRDMASGAITMVTARATPPAGTALPPDNSDEASISADGRYVVFTSTARLVARDSSNATDIYRWAREPNAFELVSIDASGTTATGSSVDPSVSADGRYVTWVSGAANVVPASAGGLTNPGPLIMPAAVIRGPSEIYLRDLVAAETIRVSVTTDRASAGSALRPSVSDDGSRVTFDTAGANLVSGDTNQALDVFLRDLPAVASAVPNPLDFGSQAVGVESLPAAVIVGSDGWADLRVASVALAGANPGDFRILADACTGNPVPRMQRCPISIAYKPTGVGARAAELRVSYAGTGSPRTVRLIGSATDARLEVDPNVGPLGRVALARGRNFPPGALVKLTWLPGITPQVPIVQADGSGNFELGVLVFHRDVLGPRLLRAEPGGGACFPVVEAHYLVVPVPGRPGGYSGSALLPEPIIRSAGDAPAGSFTAPTPGPCIPNSGPLAPVLTPAPTFTLPPGATPSPSPIPTPSPTPRPTPIPTPTPNPGPALSGLAHDLNEIYVCSPPLTVTITVYATDSAGVSSVTLWYDPPGTSMGWTSKPMTRITGSSTAGIWRGSITTAYGWATGYMRYYVAARDGLGAGSQHPLVYLGQAYPQVYVFSDSSNCLR